MAAAAYQGVMRGSMQLIYFHSHSGSKNKKVIERIAEFKNMPTPCFPRSLIEPTASIGVRALPRKELHARIRP